MKEPDRIISYFKEEKLILAVITITGIFYNIGMVAGPWFEGRLAQCLYDIISGSREYKDMLVLSALYVITISAVQGLRFLKRFYVRRFGNNVNRSMKKIIYNGLVNTSKVKIDSESTGDLMTKAISDVDACSEGMRKFTTEIFDTGVVMLSYLVMLLCYDVRLALISCIFPPFAYVIAERLKVYVTKCNIEYKKSAGRLNEATLDRVNAALTYRVFGQEENRNSVYDTYLFDYEKRAVKANLWSTSMQPVYQIISMISVIFIIWFGSKNVLGTGWSNWNIAAFTTFLACFVKLAVKSSKAAKLFNAVQKAEVSWKRILPLIKGKPSESNGLVKTESKKNFVMNLSSVKDLELDIKFKNAACLNNNLVVDKLSFHFPDEENVLRNICFDIKSGEILGVTGEIASGKSILGRVFLCEYPYEGSILYNGKELRCLYQNETHGLVSYMGHKPELLNDTIANNILLGEEDDAEYFLKAAGLFDEVSKMPEGINTIIGRGGIRLSGGQQQRVAFARALCNKYPIIILDDPFSAVDYDTEKKLYYNLRNLAKESIVILISHRLKLFPEFDKILWIEDGSGYIGTHKTFMNENTGYINLYNRQCKKTNTPVKNVGGCHER